MMVHVVLLIYISILGLFIYAKKPYRRSSNKKFILLSLLAVFLVQSLRSRYVGTDTIKYYNYVRYAKMGLPIHSMEFLFTLLVKTVAKLFGDPQFLLVISSFIVLTGVGLFIFLNIDSNKSAFWSVFFFITISQYFASMNTLRQCIAMAIGCNVFTLLQKERSRRNYIFSGILITISALFHLTGLLQILLFVPFMMKIDYKKIAAVFSTAFLALIFFPIILRIFLRIFPAYSNYLGGYFDQAASSKLYVMIGILEIVIMVLYCIYINPDVDSNQKGYRLLFITLYSFTTILLQQRMILAIRLGFYFELFLILLIPEFFERFRSINTRLALKTTAYVLGWAYYLYSIIVHGARGCVPYTFFWQV